MGRSLGCIRTVGFLAMVALLALVVVALPCASVGAASGSEFLGTWVSPDSSWTITSVSGETCVGTTALVGYSLIDCTVSGNHYTFVITQDGTSYRSQNNGTITGDTIHGEFLDTNGTDTTYVATRTSAVSSDASSLSPSGSLSQVTINATDNIFGAGLSVAPEPGGDGGGTTPFDVPVPSGTTWMTFSDVTGTVSYEPGGSNGPDGSTTGSSISAAGTISGIVDGTGVFYLTGVFLDGPQPATTSTTSGTATSGSTGSSSAPTSLDFSGDHSFPSLSPVLGQVFFIGDGLTGTGTGNVQYFQVPTGATDLYLGFADAQSFQGSPGTYSDNSGSLSANANFFTGQYSAASSSVAKGTLLGGLDVAGYCASVDNTTAELVKGGIEGTNFAYDNWECTASGQLVTMTNVCQWEYGSQAKDPVAETNDANSAYSWECYSESAGSAQRKTSAGSGVTPGSGATPGQHTAVAPIAASIGTPNQIFHSMGHNLANAVITVAAILFITFPSVIFNQTFSANYAEILLMMANFRRRTRKAFGLKDRDQPDAGSTAPSVNASGADAPGRSSRPWFYGVLVAGAVLGGLLNPKFGLNGRSAADIGATLVAFAFGTLIGWFISKTFREHHHYAVHTYLHALPLGLGVAALCVLVSRLTNFEPGYLYGVVVSIAFVETLEERHNAHLTTISTLSTLGIALLAWFLWVPVNHFALEHGGNVIFAIIDDVLASIFIGGLVGTVIGLLPLAFMPGGTLAKWRKDVWAVVFFLAVFLLVEVELRPAAGPTHPGGAPIVTALVLFAIFGGGTFWMRHFFAKRTAAKERDGALVTTSALTPEPDGPAEEET
jgi:hypothetical protein